VFRNFLITTFRNLYRHKLYSTINIGGLALGLAACWLILLFVRGETGYDSWIPNAGQIYRLHTTAYIPGRDPLRSTRSSGPMGQAIKNNFEEVENATRMFYSGPRVFHGGNVYQQSVTLVDPEFFDVFDLKLLDGNRNTALQDFQSLIVSESTARRYFGDEPVIGQTLGLCCYGPDSEQIDYRVTGVIADTPENTHFYHDAIALIDENRYQNNQSLFESWTSMNNNTYLKFADGSSTANVVDRLPWFLDNVVPENPHLVEEFGLKNSEIVELSLMPIEDIHLNAREAASDMGDIRPLGNKTLVISFLFIALLILGIAAINFLNLTTARFINRAREVSMRKILGASRREVALQFMGETVITSLLALTLSILLVSLMLPWFNEILSTELQLDLFGSGGNLLTLLVVALTTGIIGGSYPCLYVSRLQPARVFNSGRSSDGGKQSLLKNMLIIFQFSISIALITATAVTWLQTDYARSADLGYERENRIVLSGLGRSGVSEVQDTLIARLRGLPGVIGITRSSEVPTSSRENNTAFTVQGREQEVGNQILNYISADYDYFDIYGIEPIEGRVFSEEFGLDLLTATPADGNTSGSMVLNESAARRLGFANPANALGQVITTGTFGGVTPFTVVGVVPDINNRSARFESIPTLYWMRQRGFVNLTIHHDGDDPQSLLKEIETSWREIAPTAPFSYSILEEMVRHLYLDEERQVVTFSVFALLAIFISGLGLYAMASFTDVKRTREIGLRKVMGARVVEIIRLLLWQFSKPVVIANLLAWPTAWYFLNEWLDGFVYRIDLSPLYFIFAGIAALLIAWVTVVGHAWRVAQSNPIHALRYE
jgi:putative ABC transport system permease protein